MCMVREDFQRERERGSEAKTRKITIMMKNVSSCGANDSIVEKKNGESVGNAIKKNVKEKLENILCGRLRMKKSREPY